ncbi:MULTISPECIES: polysaccharide deacetylase family protein [Aminobacter]|uniref:Chitooligosaccharide deacetylase n=1 Tax=Aminobacter ciceronei TaxID=150723 RepID=A0ABR6BZK0_9HYPH|nr:MULTISPECIES: polysaccharide deacetylase [Aminobacter]MBA8904366.1 peptidoglycan/xylan/chitin deacetylase (PgdA/CDA1 family) [Aminobacter ciceronei]MBA9018144.1 peptidoglycan/xylan/chitin deacetylase (PgdA/CDA1 family) [Aminobacter ciceronei]MRX33264.1 polysaccharide deacetylase family protein [Aminobacter sp. MDW-2]QNH36881.1 polysaccharide deacetylase [Aminobacter sp. MDW-2]
MISNQIAWPNGAKCACCLTFDMDADSLIHVDYPNDGDRRVSAISMLRYGPQVAVPRIVETYRQLGIRQTFFIPAWCIEQYPQAVETILAGGHEIAHHSYIHENPLEQTAEDEAHWLDSGIEVIRRATGQSPRGWRAPLYNFSNQSLDLLLERGFSYDASLMGADIPYILKSRKTGRELIELPSHWGLDDWPQYVQSFDLNYMMPVRSARNGFDLYLREFEAAYAYGALWVPVLHPFVTGRLSRWHVFREFLEQVVTKGDVWFAPMEEIAAHVRAETEAGRHEPMVELLPQYQRPIGRVLPRR